MDNFLIRQLSCFGDQMNAIKFREGQVVQYHPVGTGTIKRVITSAELTGSAPHTVHASPTHPSYLIENSHTHKQSAVSQESIVRVIQEPVGIADVELQYPHIVGPKYRVGLQVEFRQQNSTCHRGGPGAGIIRKILSAATPNISYVIESDDNIAVVVAEKDIIGIIEQDQL